MHYSDPCYVGSVEELRESYKLLFEDSIWVRVKSGVPSSTTIGHQMYQFPMWTAEICDTGAWTDFYLGVIKEEPRRLLTVRKHLSKSLPFVDCVFALPYAAWNSEYHHIQFECRGADSDSYISEVYAWFDGAPLRCEACHVLHSVGIEIHRTDSSVEIAGSNRIIHVSNCLDKEDENEPSILVDRLAAAEHLAAVLRPIFFNYNEIGRMLLEVEPLPPLVIPDFKLISFDIIDDPEEPCRLKTPKNDETTLSDLIIRDF